jgi:hypothetical protein
MLFNPGLAARTFKKPPASGAYSTEAQQFFDRITDPGTTRKDAYAAIIDSLVADGIWAKLDALWIVAADIAGNALINLKSSSFSLTAVNSPTFVADAGYTSDGSSSYLTTGLNPTSVGGQFVKDSAHLSFWTTAALAGGGGIESAIAAFDGANFAQASVLSGATDVLMNDADQLISAGSQPAGHYIATRTASNVKVTYKNGASLTNNTAASTALINQSFFLLARNQGSAAQFTTTQYSAFSVGAGLDATEAGDFYTALNTNKWW